MVEAAGIEPDHPRPTKWLMAHDFSRKTSIPGRLSPSTESPGVPSSPLESTPVVEIFWRRVPTLQLRAEFMIVAGSASLGTQPATTTLPSVASVGVGIDLTGKRPASKKAGSYEPGPGRGGGAR